MSVMYFAGVKVENPENTIADFTKNRKECYGRQQSRPTLTTPNSQKECEILIRLGP